ncbi:nitrate transporter [Paenibacillus macerans]|nr:nitrate transporter [Paenibacillus macerans]
MERSGFWKSGHKPSLLSAFLYFDVSFMIWVLIGPLAVIMMQDYPMSASQKANLVALPVLGGSVLRLVLGVLADRIGPKRTGQIGMIVTMIPLIYGWQFVSSLGELYVVALLLGVAGASFSAALPLASRWYPPQYQGLAMGIAGAGNSGTVFSTLFANRIAQHYGSWEVVFGLALIPIAVVFIVFTLLAKDSPKPTRAQAADGLRGGARPAGHLAVLHAVHGHLRRLCGHVQLFDDFFQHRIWAERRQSRRLYDALRNRRQLFRPVGGWLADRVGGIRMLLALYGGVAVTMALISSLPPLPVVTVLLFICMMCLGMGNGSVFQLVPQRFQQEIGVITGIVGAAGGLGGYFLPNILGILKEYTGSYTPGFLILSGIAVACIVTVLLIQGEWKRTFLERSGAYDAYSYSRQS